MTSEPGRQT